MKNYVFGMLFMLGTSVTNAQVDVGNGVSLYGGVDVTTDYVFRGVSQTNEDWVVQTNLGLEFKNPNQTGGRFYVDGFATPVKFNDVLADTTWELDVAGGYRYSTQDITLDGGVVTYWYPNSAKSDLDFYEFQGNITYDFSKASIRGGVNYSPDYYGVDEQTWYWSGGGEIVPIWDIALGAEVGYLYANSDSDQMDWSVYASKSFLKDSFELKLAYYDNDTDVSFDNLKNIFDNRVVFTASARF
jgi:uncharacterized protein (TIGR02001 family)